VRLGATVCGTLAAAGLIVAPSAPAALPPGNHEVIVYDPAAAAVTAVRPDGTDPTTLPEIGAPSLSGDELIATSNFESVPGKPGLFFPPRDRITISRSNGTNDLSELGTAPSFDPTGNSLLFATSRYADAPDAGPPGDIFRTELSDFTRVNLTNTSNVDEGEPDWFPDGDRIVYESNASGPDYDVVAAAADGSGPVNLTDASADDELAPSVSPDGAKIVFVRRPPGGGPTDIWAMGADGSSPVPVTNTPTRSETDPVFSPDGSRIAFAAAPADGGRRDVYVTASDGTGETLLSGGEQGGAGKPDWGRLTVLPPPPRCFDAASNVVGTEADDVLDRDAYPFLYVASGLGGDDRIVGANLDETLCGNAGRDVLLGGSDDDTLIGGAGPDVLKGGEGRDVCIGVGKKDRAIGCKVRANDT
jgi:Ca2+-binding RTX toxin-like protein